MDEFLTKPRSNFSSKNCRTMYLNWNHSRECIFAHDSDSEFRMRFNEITIKVGEEDIEGESIYIECPTSSNPAIFVYDKGYAKFKIAYTDEGMSVNATYGEDYKRELFKGVVKELKIRYIVEEPDSSLYTDEE